MKPRKHIGKAKIIPDRDTFLLPYQARWVNDRSLVRLMEKSRRVGISYATAYDAVRQHAMKDRDVDTWFSSRDEDTAREWIRYVTKFARVLNTGAKYLGEQVLNEEKDRATVVEFLNATRINSLSSNPNAFAGKGGDAGLDEFALRADPRLLYDVAQAVIDWGGRLSIISTHRGKNNFFARLIADERDPDPRKHRGISVHTVTLTMALQEGFLYKLQCNLPESDPRQQMDEGEYYDYLRRRASTEERFKQEYECVPEDEDSVYLPYDLIAGSTYGPADNLVVHTEETVDFRGKKGRIRALLPRGVSFAGLVRYFQERRASGAELYHGRDIGRRRDLAVDYFIEPQGGVDLTRAIIEFDQVQFSSQEAHIWPLLPLVNRSNMDESGLGIQFVERAQQAFGAAKIEGYTFTAGLKEELAPPVRMAFEDRNLRIPDDDLLVDDLRMIKKTFSGTNVRFVAEDTEGNADSHADRFWALALALHARRKAVSFAPEMFRGWGVDRSPGRNNTSKFTLQG